MLIFVSPHVLKKSVALMNAVEEALLMFISVLVLRDIVAVTEKKHVVKEALLIFISQLGLKEVVFVDYHLFMHQWLTSGTACRYLCWQHI